MKFVHVHVKAEIDSFVLEVIWKENYAGPFRSAQMQGKYCECGGGGGLFREKKEKIKVDEWNQN